MLMTPGSTGAGGAFIEGEQGGGKMHPLCPSQGDPAVVVLKSTGAAHFCGFALLLEILTCLRKERASAADQHPDGDADEKSYEK
jgi:hypothetical protein